MVLLFLFAKEAIRMANISRYDQFNIDNMFDDLFKGFLVRPMRYENAPKVADIKIEVSESGPAYVSRLRYPGCAKTKSKCR